MVFVVIPKVQRTAVHDDTLRVNTMGNAILLDVLLEVLERTPLRLLR